MHVRFGNRGFRVILALEFQKLLKDKKSLNMAPLQGAIPFSTFIFLFSFFLDLTYVNSLFIVIFAKVCLYIGLTSMIQQITNELIRTTRISYRFQGTNSGFKSYFSTKKLKSMVGIDPIIPFIQKIKSQFDKNSILTNEVPKGYLLVGHPGTGKTLLAKVIAGETEARLFPIVASEFFLAGSGIGTIRLREFFQEAKQNSPSIIFIDEIDSIGGVRNGSMGNIKSSQFIVESPSQLGLWKQNPSNWARSVASSHTVKSNPIITNEFLIQIDGFSQRNSVILIGATNFVHSLDKALLRPGRFDCIIKLNPPDKFLQINVFNLYLQEFDKLYIPPKSQITQKLSESIAYNMSDLARVASESSLKVLRDQTPVKMVQTLDHALMRTFFCRRFFFKSMYQYFNLGFEKTVESEYKNLRFRVNLNSQARVTFYNTGLKIDAEYSTRLFRDVLSDTPLVRNYKGPTCFPTNPASSHSSLREESCCSEGTTGKLGKLHTTGTESRRDSGSNNPLRGQTSGEGGEAFGSGSAKLNQNFKHKPSLRYIHIKRQKKQSSRPLTKETLHRNLSNILAGLVGQLYAEYSLSLLASPRNEHKPLRSGQRYNPPTNSLTDLEVVTRANTGSLCLRQFPRFAPIGEQGQHLALPTSIQYEKINNILIQAFHTYGMYKNTVGFGLDVSPKRNLTLNRFTFNLWSSFNYSRRSFHFQQHFRQSNVSFRSDYKQIWDGVQSSSFRKSVILKRFSLDSLSQAQNKESTLVQYHNHIFLTCFENSLSQNMTLLIVSNILRTFALERSYFKLIALYTALSFFP